MEPQNDETPPSHDENEEITDLKQEAYASLIINVHDTERPVQHIHRRVKARYIRENTLLLEMNKPTIIDGRKVSTVIATRLIYDEEHKVVKQPNRRVLLSHEDGTKMNEGIIGILTYETWQNRQPLGYVSGLIQKIRAKT